MKNKLFTLIISFLLTSIVFAQPPSNVPEARYGHTMINLPDGSVILIGGEDASGHLLNDMHTFDGAWSEIQSDDPPPPRRDYQAWVRDDDVYIHGGVGENNLLDDTWKYDVATNEWTQITQPGDKPSPRYDHSVVSVNDKDYLYGGRDNSGTGLMDFWSYDTNTNTWQEDDELHPPSSGHAIGVIGGTIYAYGGIRWNEDDFRNDTRYYETPLGNTWTFTYTSGDVPGPFAFMYHTFMQFAGANSMFLFGGKNGDKETLSDFYEFNMETQTWTQLSEGPPPLSNGDMATYWDDTDTLLILFGGKNSSGEVVDENWKYDLQSGSWEIITDVDEDNNQNLPQVVFFDNYPNPFKTSTTISYKLREKKHVNISIYNIKGQCINTLIDGTKSKGMHEVEWTGRSDKGNDLSSGIYFIKLKSDNVSPLIKKCFYIKTSDK